MKTFETLKGVFGSGERVFVIERVKSGATPYGDGSAHVLKIYDNNNKLIETKNFDTRYEGLTTDIVKWCVFWCDFIKTYYDAKDLFLTYYHKYEEVLKDA